MMFKSKSVDQFLTVSFQLFRFLTIFAVLYAFYEKFTGRAETVDLGAAFTFLCCMFLARYNYAIQYGLQKLEMINQAERQRQLQREQEQR